MGARLRRVTDCAKSLPAPTNRLKRCARTQRRASDATEPRAPMTLHSTIRSVLISGVGGFFTRPCCVMPTVLSFVGVGTAGLSTVAAHRVPFLVVSALLLACS